jgi:isochorismate synthase EntC
MGWGIVADSDPEKEWQETMTKARGMCQSLGVDMKMLEAL